MEISEASESYLPNDSHATVSFNCTACGKCCNSAPLMSIPELFHHQTLFVGALGIRRITRHKPADRLISAGQPYTLSSEDAETLREMASLQLFTHSQTGYDFSIMTQAIDYESLNQCPALQPDHSCGIHHNHKPTVCSMVPFDSLYPDSLQNLVLISRQYSENCIVVGKQSGYEVVIENREVVNQPCRTILNKRRYELSLEKRNWGNAVFAQLQADLLNQPGELAKLPINDGLLSLSIIPALMVLAGVSEKCRVRCLDYADNQIYLIDNMVQQAVKRKNPADKQFTLVLRTFKQQYLTFRNILVDDTFIRQALQGSDNDEWVSGIEAYLPGCS